MENTQVKKIVEELLKDAEGVSKLSAMDVVAKCMQLVEKLPKMSGTEKKEIVMKVIERIAAGQDGVIGTSDDRLSPAVVAGIQSLLKGNLVSDTIELLVRVAKREVPLKELPAKAAPIAFGCLRVCFGGKQNQPSK